MLILLIFQTITTITQLAKRLLSSIRVREFHKVFYFAHFVEDSSLKKKKGDFMKNDVITVRVCGLSLKEVLEKLGGMGRGQPVRAISLGDVFAERDKYKRDSDFLLDHACENCKNSWADMLLFNEQEEKENQDKGE